MIQSLKASIKDGSGAFAGEVLSGDATRAGAYSVMQPNGYIEAVPVSDSDTAFRCFSRNQNKISYIVKADGSSTFAGTGIFGGNPDNGGNQGIRLWEGGAISAARASTGQAVFSGYVVGTSTPNVTIYGDGSSTFAGAMGVTVNNDAENRGGINIRNTGTGPSIVGISGDGYDRFRVENNGTVYTYEDVKIGNGLYINDRTNSGTNSIEITNNGTVSTKSYFTSERDTAGKSLYAGNLNGVESLNIVADGSIYAGNIAGAGTAGPGNVNIQLNASDGSAKFAGGVNVGDTLIVNRGLAGDKNNVTISVGNADNANVITLNNNGSATFAGTVTATVVPPSDARFKENITPAKPQLADVVALGGLLKNYDWTDEAPLNEELRSVRQLGLVAQEVAEVCPSLVKDINRTKTMEITPAVVGPKGRVITEAVTSEVDDSYKGLSQEALIMKLIGAVAELSAEVEALKAA